MNETPQQSGEPHQQPMDNPGENNKSMWSGVSTSLEQTLRLGRLMAGVLRVGDVLALDGELGAGKTQLVRGLAEGLGMETRQVASPTFVMVHEYQRPPAITQKPASAAASKLAEAQHHKPELPGVLVHIDAYRLRSLEELETIGWSSHESDAGDVLGEIRQGAAVVIEWAEKLGPALGTDVLRFRLYHHAVDARAIEISATGSWLQRSAEILKCLQHWSEPASQCPICGKLVEQNQEQFPFCGKRCRMVDLGKWLGDGYRISRPVEQRDLEEGMD